MFGFSSGFIAGALVSWVVFSAKRKDKKKKALMRDRTMARAQDDLTGKRRRRRSKSEMRAALDECFADGELSRQLKETRARQRRERVSAFDDPSSSSRRGTSRHDAFMHDHIRHPHSLGSMGDTGNGSSCGGGSSSGGSSSGGGSSCGGGGGGGGD